MILLAQAEDFSLKQFLALLGQAGGYTVMIGVTWAWLTRRIRTAGEAQEANERTEEMRKERDEWKAMALRSLDITERSQDNTVTAARVAQQAIAKTGSNP